ncbi:MAG: uroporphyrinogen decarboxylase family protein [Anaerolineales bacterium]
MSNMDSGERITAVWNRQQPDRTPWSPMLGDSYLRSQPNYWDRLDQEQRRAFQSMYRYPSIVALPADLDFLDPLVEEMTEEVGGDYLSRIQTVEAVDDKVEIEMLPDESGATKTIFRTPWGDLNETVSGGDSSETVYRVKFAISDRDQYEVMRKIVGERRYQSNYECYREAQDKLRGKGAVSIAGPDQPLVALFRVREPQDLIFDLTDEPERMTDLLELLHQRAMEGYRLIASGPGLAVETGMAFMTTRLISPRLFEHFVLPYLADYAQVLHRAGKILICHMCGHILHLLPMLREAEIDGIDSLSTPPIGDTELETYWQILGDQAILQAGLDVAILQEGTIHQVRMHVRDVLRRSQGRSLILRSADEVPHGTPTENLMAVAEEVRSFG